MGNKNGELINNKNAWALRKYHAGGKSHPPTYPVLILGHAISASEDDNSSIYFVLRRLGVLVKARAKSFPYRDGRVCVGTRLIFASISLRSRNIVLIIIKEKRLSKNTGNVSW